MTETSHTATSYSHGCRCGPCRRLHARKVATLRARRRADRTLINGRLVAVEPTVVHGLYSTYINWSCRCPECTTAQRDRRIAVANQRRAERDGIVEA